MKLVDDAAQQDVLEMLLEGSKPPLPSSASRLHYLLATPFRYHPLRSGSRFRGPTDAGVFYGGECARTTCAELGYWRWKFLQDAVVSLRNGRYVVPVRAEYRGEVGGVIHDVSSTGATVFVEPTAVVEANARIMQRKPCGAFGHLWVKTV